MAGRQPEFGSTTSRVRWVFQESVTGVGGSIVNAAATLASSIGVAKSSAIGPYGGWFTRRSVPNRTPATGANVAGGRAVLSGGATVPIIASPSSAPTPSARPTRAATERRSRAER